MGKRGVDEARKGKVVKEGGAFEKRGKRKSPGVENVKRKRTL